jgi:hypothetical protein
VSAGVLVIAGVVIALLVVYRGWLRRALFELEDPRSLAMVRIVFAFGLLLGVLELVQDARWFFSDEGMFLGAGARARFAGSSLAGFGDEGFRGLAGLWHYVAGGTASTLHFWDSPAVVAGHAVLLVLAVVGLMIGWRTRVCAWACVVLELMLLRRNNAMWGGEQVYVAVLFLLAVSRCGVAYSVDNWLRCRRLRRRRLLSEPGTAGDGAGVAPGGEYPQGLAAVVRGVPAWSRLLIVLQLGVLYCANGLAKWGPAWEAGTATAYALQSDSYTRFDTLPLLAVMGETAIRWGTWAARGWETLFPAVVVGLAIAWGRRARLRTPRGARWLWGMLWIAVVATLAVGGGLLEETGAGWAALMAVLGQGGEGVQWRPLMVWGLLAVAVWAARGDSPGREFVRRWVLGRRVWLGVGVVFHGVLQILLNLGGFPLATVGLYIACFTGAEVAGVVARVRGGRAVPMEDLGLPQLHRDSAEMPGWALAGVGAGLLGAVVVAGFGVGAAIRWTVIVAAGVLVAVGWRTARVAAMDGPVVWGYGPLGRLLVGALCVGHGVAIVVSQIPERPLLIGARRAGRGLVERWLVVTGTLQKWAMFSPQPPQAGGSLRAEIVDDAGEVYGTELSLHRDEELGGVQWWPDRRRKILLNVMAERKGLLDWYGRAVCRQWALGHGGEAPRSVQLTMHWAKIPLPWEALPAGDRVERFAARATTSVIWQGDCRREPHGQLPAEVRARHGFAAGPFVPLPPREDRWPTVRARYGAGWPYDEWLALVVLVACALRWRREDRARHRIAVASRREK